MTAAGSEVQLPAALVAALASNDDDNRLYFTAAVWVYVDGELSLGDQVNPAPNPDPNRNLSGRSAEPLPYP